MKHSPRPNAAIASREVQCVIVMKCATSPSILRTGQPGYGQQQRQYQQPPHVLSS